MFTTINKLYLSLIAVLMFNVGYSQCDDLPDNSLSISGSDILYNSTESIGGFQFNVDDATINGLLTGGDATANGFTVSNRSSTVLGFSFTGGVIPSGCGTLVSLDLDGDPSGLSGIVISDPTGTAIDFSYHDSSGGGDDCASGIYDCAGVCDGDTEEDCAGDCAGSSEVDECGDCAGNGATILCDDGSFVCDESECESDAGDIESGCDLPDNNLYLMDQ